MSNETNIFDHTKIKTVNIEFNELCWNAKTHYVVISYDPNLTAGISAKLVPICQEKEITDVSLAESVLNKFMINK